MIYDLRFMIYDLKDIVFKFEYSRFEDLITTLQIACCLLRIGKTKNNQQAAISNQQLK